MPPAPGTTYKRRLFTYAPFGRLAAAFTDDLASELIAEHLDNGLRHQIMSRHDANANASVASTKHLFDLHDDREQVTGLFRNADATPKESFAYHATDTAPEKPPLSAPHPPPQPEGLTVNSRR